MADFGGMIDLSEVQAAASGSRSIPSEGWHKIAGIRDVLKDTKANNGSKCLHVTFRVLEGEETGKRFLGFINVKNASAEAERIGRSELKAWAIAAGAPNPNQLMGTTEILNRPFMARIEHEVGEYTNARIAEYVSVSKFEQGDGDFNQEPPPPMDADRTPADDAPF